MGSRNMHEDSAADGTTDQSRREALKRFGRYAAAASTAMPLLEPREGHADEKNEASSDEARSSDEAEAADEAKAGTATTDRSYVP